MKHLLLPLALCLVVAGCDSVDTAGLSDETTVEATASVESAGDQLLSKNNPNSCWGQASKVFALARKMGYHSANQENPRDGLRNLARNLYEDGVIDEPTMAALGEFVADLEGYSIEACGT